MKRIFLSPPWVDSREREAVKRAFDSGYIAPCGPMVDEFERKLAQFSGMEAAAVSSGTGAIDLLMMELGVGRGDVVVSSDLTFIATVGPAFHRGAKPVFVDSDPETGTMDPRLLDEALSSLKAKCVVAADIYGQCCDYDAISEVCERHGVPLIVDAAESMGARYRGREAGDAGIASVYSFNGNKIITTSGGGAVLSHDAGIVERARKRAQQSREKAIWYEHAEVGSNYRMSNILAAVGIAQIEKFKRILKAKYRAYAFYKGLVAAGEGLFAGSSLFPCGKDVSSSHWLSVVEFSDTKARDEAIRRLEAASIEARPVWKPMHMQKVFEGEKAFGGAVAEDLFNRGVCMPSGAGLDESDFARISAALK